MKQRVRTVWLCLGFVLVFIQASAGLGRATGRMKVFLISQNAKKTSAENHFGSANGKNLYLLSRNPEVMQRHEAPAAIQYNQGSSKGGALLVLSFVTGLVLAVSFYARHRKQALQETLNAEEW